MISGLRGPAPAAFLLAALAVAFSPSPAAGAGEGGWIQGLLERLAGIREQAERKIETADQTLARAEGVLSLARKENDRAAEDVAIKARSRALEAKRRYQRILSRASASLENTRRLSDLVSREPGALGGAGVIYRTGDVRMRRGPGYPDGESPSEDGLLRPGDGIATGAGGSAELRLMTDGSRLDVGTETSLSIVDDRTVALDFGRVILDVRRWIEGRMKRFEVRTPAAVCGVRGTRFAVSSDADGTVTLSVLEGEVQFSRPDGKEGVLVPAGRQSVMVPGGSPSPPREFETAAFPGFLDE